MKAEDLDKKFDEGENIADYLDLAKTRRPGRKSKRVNVDFPEWMIDSLDKEAKRLGVARQSIIKIWIAERLKEISKQADKWFSQAEYHGENPEVFKYQAIEKDKNRKIRLHFYEGCMLLLIFDSQQHL